MVTELGFPALVDVRGRRSIADLLSKSRDRYEAYLADKDFSAVDWEKHWLERYGAMVAATPKNNSSRVWPKADRRWASGKRQIIEGVIGELKDFFGLERHRTKTLQGLLTRLAAKVAAYTCGQRPNDRLGRPLRHLADLLIYFIAHQPSKRRRTNLIPRRLTPRSRPTAGSKRARPPVSGSGWACHRFEQQCLAHLQS